MYYVHACAEPQCGSMPHIIRRTQQSFAGLRIKSGSLQPSPTAAHALIQSSGYELGRVADCLSASLPDPSRVRMMSERDYRARQTTPRNVCAVNNKDTHIQEGTPRPGPNLSHNVPVSVYSLAAFCRVVGGPRQRGKAR
jgi:hypothetical protein